MALRAGPDHALCVPWPPPAVGCMNPRGFLGAQGKAPCTLYSTGEPPCSARRLRPLSAGDDFQSAPAKPAPLLRRHALSALAQSGGVDLVRLAGRQPRHGLVDDIQGLLPVTGGRLGRSESPFSTPARNVSNRELNAGIESTLPVRQSRTPSGVAAAVQSPADGNVDASLRRTGSELSPLVRAQECTPLDSCSAVKNARQTIRLTSADGPRRSPGRLRNWPGGRPAGRGAR
jgi:hypothetical protein